MPRKSSSKSGPADPSPGWWDFVPAARRRPLPQVPPPAQLAVLASEPPQGPQWLHEIKLDGYRMRLRRDGQDVRFVSRSGKDWTDRFPDLAAGAAELPADQLLLDGEVVVLAEDGTSSFQSLQEVVHRGGRGVQYFVFDLLHLDQFDLTRVPLEQRKALLATLLADPPLGFRYCDHIDGDGPDVFDQARRLGVEGIVSKRRDQPYRGKRTPEWIKVKCVQREEFVVVGFTPSSANRAGFGALVLGAFDEAGQLRFAGKVGSGFSEEALTRMRQQLDALATPDCPLVQPPLATQLDAADRAGVAWVRPELVVQVEFVERTREGHLRHPTFQGVREDCQAGDLVEQARIATADELRRPTPPGTPATARGVTPEGDTAESHPPVSAASGRSRVDVPENLRFTHADRLLFPEAGISKLGLAAYYLEVAPRMLPLVVDRPLSLVRAPRGVAQQRFFQKHAMQGLPDAVRRLEVEKRGNETTLLYVQDLEGLLALVQFSVVEFHVWGARRDRLDRPDQLWFDLDPDHRVPWQVVVGTAERLRRSLQDRELQAFVKVSGGKGLHLVVPLERRYDWDAVRQFGERIVGELMRETPSQLTLSPSKAARPGKIFVDVLRNARGATTVAPYSTRARPEASVSLPIAWEELTWIRGGNQFQIPQVVQRLQAKEADPWRELPGLRQRLPKS